MRGWRNCVVLFAALFVGLGALCTDSLAGEGDFKANVFGSLGLSLSDSGSLGFIRDYDQRMPVRRGELSYLGDSNLGVQFFAQYKKISGVLQFLGRDRQGSDVEHFVNYAYVDVHVSNELTLRIGKNPLEIYLTSDNRAVGYSQLWIRPVPEVYSLLFAESCPGVDIRYDQPLGDGILTVNGFVGTLGISLLPKTASSADYDYKYDPLLGIAVRFSTFDSVFFVSYMNARVKHLDAELASLTPVFTSMALYGIPGADKFARFTGMDDVPVHYIIAGGSTELDEWILKGEVDCFVFEQVGNLRVTTGYLMAGYRLGEWIPYGILAGLHLKKDNIEIPVASLAEFPQEAALAAEAMNTIYKHVHGGQVSVNLGVRWDFRPEMAMKLQWGHYWVKEGGSLLWRTLNEEGYDKAQVNVLSASFDFAF